MISSESKLAYEKLKDSGYLKTVDNIVYVLIYEHGQPIDVHQAYKLLGDTEIKYNPVQQAFTRLKKKGLIQKVGSHKGILGFKKGLHEISREIPEQGELF